jgi:hypothetical protein
MIKAMAAVFYFGECVGCDDHALKFRLAAPTTNHPIRHTVSGSHRHARSDNASQSCRLWQPSVGNRGMTRGYSQEWNKNEFFHDCWITIRAKR